MSRHEIFLVIKWRGFALCRFERVLRLVSLLTLDNIIYRFIRVGFVISYYVTREYQVIVDFRYVSDLLLLVQLRHTLSWYLCTINLVRLARCVAVSGYFTLEPSSGKVSSLLSDLHVSLCTELSSFPEPIRKVTYLLSHIEMNGTYAMI